MVKLSTVFGLGILALFFAVGGISLTKSAVENLKIEKASLALKSASILSKTKSQIDKTKEVLK